MRPGLLPARSVMPAFVFFVMPATERAPPLNEKKSPGQWPRLSQIRYTARGAAQFLTLKH